MEEKNRFIKSKTKIGTNYDCYSNKIIGTSMFLFVTSKIVVENDFQP